MSGVNTPVVAGVDGSESALHAVRWAALEARRRHAGLRLVHAFGIPVGQALRVQSSEIRVKRRQWAEEAAQKVPVKILVPLIFCILPTLFIAVLGPAGIHIMENFSGTLSK